MLYAPAINVSCVRLLVAYACEQGLSLYHSDIDQAFLRADLSETVFIRMPPGCGLLSGKVQNKSLYGLRQASRHGWLSLLRKASFSLGF